MPEPLDSPLCHPIPPLQPALCAHPGPRGGSPPCPIPATPPIWQGEEPTGGRIASLPRCVRGAPSWDSPSPRPLPFPLPFPWGPRSAPTPATQPRCHLASPPQDGGAAAPRPPPRELHGPARPFSSPPPSTRARWGSAAPFLPQGERWCRPEPQRRRPHGAPNPGRHLLLTINLSAFSCSTASAGSMLGSPHPSPWVLRSARGRPLGGRPQPTQLGSRLLASPRPRSSYLSLPLSLRRPPPLGSIAHA